METGVFIDLSEFNIASLLLLYRLAFVDLEFLVSTRFEELLFKLGIAGVCMLLFSHFLTGLLLKSYS